MRKERKAWKKERLQAVFFCLEGVQSFRQIEKNLGRSTTTLQNWFDKYKEGGVASLFKKSSGKGSAPALD